MVEALVLDSLQYRENIDTLGINAVIFLRTSLLIWQKETPNFI